MRKAPNAVNSRELGKEGRRVKYGNFDFGGSCTDLFYQWGIEGQIWCAIADPRCTHYISAKTRLDRRPCTRSIIWVRFGLIIRNKLILVFIMAALRIGSYYVANGRQMNVAPTVGGERWASRDGIVRETRCSRISWVRLGVLSLHVVCLRSKISELACQYLYDSTPFCFVYLC